MNRFKREHRFYTGFTIVELLIVIVVIGILATITIIAFNGIRQRAIITTLQSDLGNSSTQLKSTQVITGSYPGDTSSLKASSGTAYVYTSDNTTNPQLFCLTAINNGFSYYADQTGAIQSGTCPGQNITWAIASTLPTKYWQQVSMSGDGTKLLASANSDLTATALYRSTDGSANWSTANRPVVDKDVRSPFLITVDGSRVIASGFGNGTTSIYVSTDFGTSWTLTNGGGQLVQFSASTNGMIMYAAEYYDFDLFGGGVRKSTDGGLTWSPTLTSLPDNGTTINATATSSDGLKVVAAPNNQTTLKYSVNGGTSWTALAASGARSWTDVVMSSDGTKIAAIGNGTIYTSADSGATWNARTGPGMRSALAMSSDGSKLISVNTVSGQSVYTSSDSGVSWTSTTSLGMGFWKRPSISNDGIKYVALNVTGGNTVVYIGTYR